MEKAESLRVIYSLRLIIYYIKINDQLEIVKEHLRLSQLSIFSLEDILLCVSGI
jgi:hypothetical protein